MKLSDFDIEFIKFKNEKDSFSYKINDTFFELKENSLYSSCDIEIKVLCVRSDSNIKLTYEFAGYVNEVCERCLSDIKIEIDTHREEPLKITGNDDLLKEEHYLSVNHQVYNIYDSIYEQICLSIPTRKICEHSISKRACEIDHTESNEEEPYVDDRWKELKKLIKE